MHRLIDENDRRKEIERELRLSESKQRELLGTVQEADRRKDQFLAILSHELRNPLTPIRTSVEILKLDGISDLIRTKAVQITDRQAKHLVRILDDLLDISRITRGKIQLKKESIDLVKLAREVVEDHHELAEKSGVALLAELPSEPVWVYGDSTRLVQIISNLINNAVKFSSRGGRILISMRVSADGNSVVTTVDDSGVGMNPETLIHLFEPFHQLDQSRGGLGLGLSLVKGLTALHGGEVRATSKGPGLGSQLSVMIPIATQVKLNEPRITPAAKGVSRRVLVIDDQFDIVDCIRDLLEHLGHQVKVELNGRRGLQTAHEFQPEIIFCDLGLPDGFDGYAVARALRADPALSSTYLVAISGYGHAEDKTRARDAGFNMHLTKPVESADMLHILAAYRDPTVTA